MAQVNIRKYYHISFILRDYRNISLTEVEHRKANGLEADEKLYVMFFEPPDNAIKEQLKIYFSDLVFNNYFSIIIYQNGQIKHMFWDKP